MNLIEILKVLALIVLSIVAAFVFDLVIHKRP